MIIRYERPVSRTAFWSRRLSVFALALFLVATAAHRFGPLSTPSFLAILAVAAAIAGLAALMALSGLWALWSVGAKGGKAAAAALFMASVPLFPPALAVAPFLTLPSIRDITTDPVDPPPFITDPAVDQVILPAQPPVTASDRAAQMIAYPEVSSRRYEGGIDRVLAAVRKVSASQWITIARESGVSDDLKALPETELRQADEADEGAPPDVIPLPEPRPDADLARSVESRTTASVGRPGDVLLEGHLRSLVFGFHSDLVIRLREEAETTLVDMRVASRYGAHDLGAGSRTIQSMLIALDAELLGIAGE